MNLYINGNVQHCPDQSTLLDVILLLELNPERIVAEHNQVIVPSAQFAETLLAEGDRLELLQFVGGG